MDSMRRHSLPVLAAVLLVALGLAGLVRGSLPQRAVADSVAAGATGAPIVVGGAYVREPANGVNAAAYFTVHSTTEAPDGLSTVESGAGAQASLHTEHAAPAPTAEAPR